MPAKKRRKSSKKKSAKKTVRKVAKKTATKTSLVKKLTIKTLTKQPSSQLSTLHEKVGKAYTIVMEKEAKARARRFGKGGRLQGPVYNPRAQREGERSRIVDMFSFGAGSGV